MNRIKSVTNYTFTTDMLDGQELQANDKIKVQWNDGTITTENVLIDEKRERYSDQGESGYIIERKSYVNVIYHNTSLICYLNKCQVLCERV